MSYKTLELSAEAAAKVKLLIDEAILIVAKENGLTARTSTLTEPVFSCPTNEDGSGELTVEYGWHVVDDKIEAATRERIDALQKLAVKWVHDTKDYIGLSIFEVRLLWDDEHLWWEVSAKTAQYQEVGGWMIGRSLDEAEKFLALQLDGR